MCCHINVNAVCLDRAAAVLCHINLSIDHDLASVRNLRRIYSDRIVFVVAVTPVEVIPLAYGPQQMLHGQ